MSISSITTGKTSGDLGIYIYHAMCLVYNQRSVKIKKEISRILFSKTEKVSGWSGSDLTISIKSLAGIAMFDWIDDSIEMFDVNDVSMSDAVICKLLLIISNKKQSRIGSVLLLFNIDPKTCKFFSKLSEEIINFI